MGFNGRVGYPVIGFLPLLTGWKLADPKPGAVSL